MARQLGGGGGGGVGGGFCMLKQVDGLDGIF